MTAPGFDPKIVEGASDAQAAAADPRASVFVEANAGSGKTRVLVDRVARLLLGAGPDTPGAAPERILCVTFTKAAAGEMKARLFRKLGDWSTADDAALSRDLARLTGEAEPPTPERLAQARRLFARALETPGGLKVQTLHAFCEGLLRRFPLEAGLPPGFITREDAEADAAGRAALETALADPQVQDAVGVILERAGADSLQTIARAARQERHALRKAVKDAGGSLEGLLSRAADAFGVDARETPRDYADAFWSATDIAALEEAAHAYAHAKSPTDIKRGAALKAVLASRSADPAQALRDYIAFRHTAKGELVQSMATKALAADAPSLLALFGEAGSETRRIRAAKDYFANLADFASAAAALQVACAVVEAYEAGLARDRAADFSALIVRARDLLNDSEARDWTRFKLDQGLDHVLVDEAQDTAPEQWAVVRALTEEFFAGEGAHDTPRTLFCVGDEKQSIYSFQNADPKRFIDERARIEAAAAEARTRFASPPLTVSFRSSAEVLAAVDLAFEPERLSQEAQASQAPRAPELKFLPPEDAVPFQRYAGHSAARANTPGTVEIWPPVPRPQTTLEEDAADAPLDQPRTDSANHRLADAVAAEIAVVLERGDAVWQEAAGGWTQRPARPGDILVLVRKRGPIFNLTLRALKARGLPVAGADRISLPEELVVDDLAALARFSLLPEDDLAVAELLRCPAFHPAGAAPVITEEVLFELTRLPGRRLWDKLRASADPRLEDARAALGRARARVDIRAPYAFFAEFLNERAPTGETRLARFYARLGEEARDPLETLMDRALAHERDGAPSLLGFLRALEADGGDIKRESESGRDEVRLMTVHGAKGLEAPIVFLPDTNSPAAENPRDGLMKHVSLGLLHVPKASEAGPAASARLDAFRKADAAEHARLLYVALTRARDRLVVCAAKAGHGEGQVREGAWYDRLNRMWDGPDWKPVETALHALPGAEDWGLAPARRFGADPVAAGPTAGRTAGRALPDWARRDALAEPQAPRPVAPSRLAADDDAFEPPSLSPLAPGGAERFRRGSLIHKLLQTLPDVPQERRASAARRYLDAQPDLDAARRAEIERETFAVLEDERFAHLFGPGSRAEVALAGGAPDLPGGARISGQIDRLVIAPHEILIVDYKTNRPPPERPEDASPAYLAQMAAYQAVLRQLHPDRPVRCALLWTDGPRWMPLPDPLLKQALEKSRA